MMFFEEREIYKLSFFSIIWLLLLFERQILTTPSIKFNKMCIKNDSEQCNI